MKTMTQSPRWIAAALFAVLVPTTGIQAQLILGGPSADGALEVREAASADSLIFEVDPIGRQVRIGSNAPGDETNVDLVVADHNNDGLAMQVDGSSSILIMGSASNTDDGDILIYDGEGEISIAVNGETGGLTLGGSGEDGDLSVTNSLNSETFGIVGSSGTATQTLSGEGLVKAWCRVGSGGALLGGHRCSATNYEGAGQFYSADFTALATDISARGIMITVNEYGSDQNCTGETLPSDLSKLRISCTGQVQFIVAIF